MAKTLVSRDHKVRDDGTGNPTGGIHMKLVLVKLDDGTWTALGNPTGGEVSHKINCEVVLMTDAAAVHARLLEVFEHDWALLTR